MEVMEVVTNINHRIRTELDLNYIEYIVADCFYRNEELANQWTRIELAAIFGVTKQTIINAIKRLLELGFLEKMDDRSLVTTPKWNRNFFAQTNTVPAAGSKTYEPWRPDRPLIMP